jgi:hypothetical protein
MDTQHTRIGYEGYAQTGRLSTSIPGNTVGGLVTLGRRPGVGGSDPSAAQGVPLFISLYVEQEWELETVTPELDCSRQGLGGDRIPIWKGKVVAVHDAVLGVLGVHVSQTLHHPGDIVIFFVHLGGVLVVGVRGILLLVLSLLLLHEESKALCLQLRCEA